MDEPSFAKMDTNLVLLADPVPRTSGEFRSLNFDEGYSYFSRFPDEARGGELSELAYHFHRTSRVQAFGVAGQGDVFLLDQFYVRKRKH